MRLSERFTDNSVIINSQSSTKEQILNELVYAICDSYKF